MNILDSVIAAISPTAGLRREIARQTLSAVRSHNAYNHYDGANPDRSLEGWLVSGNSANSEVGAYSDILRQRARDLGRNNPFICRAYDLLSAKMVGTGIRPRLAEEIPDQIRQRTMDSWKIWVDEADNEGLVDLYSLQSLVARTVVESGEALIRFEPKNDGRRVPWTIRILEPDYIDTSRHYVLDNGGAVILGVEYNISGERVAYHLFNEHPGADLFTRRRDAGRVDRVPADLVAPVYYKMRPEQSRGVPWCAPSIVTSKNLDDLNDARLKRSKVQACFAAFVRKQPEPGSLTTDSRGRRRQQLAPGIIEYLQPEEEVSFASPPQAEGDDNWTIMLLHTIAAGLGLTYSQLTGDLRQVNYSSIRAGTLDFWSLLDNWQQLMLKPMMCRPLWSKFDRVEGSRQRRLSILNVEWQFPDRDFIDPLKDGQALDAELLSGRRTFHEIISAAGKDPEVHIAELKREREELDGLNLPFIVEPKVKAVSPAAAAPANQDQQDGTQQQEDQSSPPVAA